MKIKINGDYSLYEGVSVNNGNVTFNFNRDDIHKDTLFLTQDNSFHKICDGYEYFAAYTYNKNNENYKSDSKIIRNYLKSPENIYSSDVEELVDNGVLRLDSVVSCESFDVIVSPESSNRPSIVNDIMEATILTYGGGLPTTINLIKNCYDNIEFKEDKIVSILKSKGWNEHKISKIVNFTKDKFCRLKDSGSLFEIKRFIPPEIRSAFENYLVFKSESDKALYASLQEGKVLLFDDFVTSGSTIKEMMRYLNSINPNTELTVFALVDQKQ